MTTYDAIVLGTGAVGTAALSHLARRGARVLGLDRFPPGHDRGSSHGHSRIIRQAYCEHADYVPLVQRAYELWSELEQDRGEQLYFQTGVLQVGPPDGLVLPGVFDSAGQHGLDVDSLDAAEVAERFPGFRLPPGTAAVFEHRAGYLLVEQCVQAQAEQALQQGAELRIGEAVRRWQAADGSVRVETQSGWVSAGRLVITAGAWAAELLADLGIPLKILRKHLHWFANQDPRYQAQHGCPVFLFELPEGIFYGMPQVDERGVKLAEHTGGDPVTDPLQLDRNVDPRDRARVAQFLTCCLPGALPQPTHHAACMYTMSPDQHFIVDRHPEYPQVAFATGLSGHGFKFAPVLGEALADLTLQGGTELPIQFLRSSRPGLRGG